MARKGVATDPATKGRALQIAAEHGAAVASQQTGVPEGTIRSWRARSGQSAPAFNGDDFEVWYERRKKFGERLAKTAEDAVEQAQVQLRLGFTTKGKDAAIAAGIALDKAAAVELQLQTARESHEQHRLQLIERFASQVAQLLRAIFGDQRLILSPAQYEAAINVAADHLRALGPDGPVVAVLRDDVERVSAAVRAYWRTKLEAEIRAEIAAEQKQLPAPSEPDLQADGSHPDGGGPGAEGDRPPDVFPGDETEVVDAVVVPDVPVRRAFEVVREPEFGFATAQPSRWR